MISVVRSYKHRTINATPSPCWAESGHSWGSFAKVCVQLCKPMGKVTVRCGDFMRHCRRIYVTNDNNPGSRGNGRVREFCSSRAPACAVVGTCTRMEPLGSLAAGMPHGRCDASDQAGGPLACGAGGGTQAQGGCLSDTCCPLHPAPV